MNKNNNILQQNFKNVKRKNPYRKGILSNYFKLYSITPYIEDLRGAIIAGGCFKNIFNNMPARDIDVFFEREEDFEQAVEIYEHRVKDGDLSLDYENDNCRAYKTNKGVSIELIRSIFGSPKHILDNFDFTVVKFAISGIEEDQPQVLYHEDFFEHLHLKRLVIEPDLPKPIATFNRTLKYAKYGFSLCRGSKASLVTQIKQTEDGVEDLNGELYGGWD